jgi:hypothetical protein
VSTSRNCPLCERDAGVTMICERCVRATERRLGDIPALVDELELTLSRQGRGGRGAGHRKRGDDQPLPFDIAASGKRSLINLLAEWADLAAAESHAGGMPWHHSQWESDLGQTRAAVSVLQRHLSWFRVGEQAPIAARAIETIRNQLRSAIDRVPERLWAGPCHAELPAAISTTEAGAITVTLNASDTPPRCELQLYRKWGEELITCDGHNDPDETGGCGAVHTIDGRRDFLLTSIEEQLLPLRLVWESLYELLPGCNIAWETVRKWPRKQTKPRRDPRTGQPLTDRRGRRLVTVVPPRLHVRTVNLLGTELFRGGDIIDLARDEIPRRGAKRTRYRHRKPA